MDVTLILVTLLSLGLALVMTALAWRLAREERRRSEARVSALALEIRHGSDLPLHHPAPVVTSTDLFATPAGPSASSSRAAAAVVVAIGLVVLAAFIWSLASHSPVTSGSAPVAASASAPRTEPSTTVVPLELTALAHDRDGDRLTVRGIVHNPASGPRVRALTAVVFLFDRDGGFVTSGRVPIDALAPGAASNFVVTIPNVKEVGRYRVSFRTEDRIVPHVDRRERPLAQANKS